MKKRLITATLILALCFTLVGPAFAAGELKLFLVADGATQEVWVYGEGEGLPGLLLIGDTVSGTELPASLNNGLYYIPKFTNYVETNRIEILGDNIGDPALDSWPKTVRLAQTPDGETSDAFALTTAGDAKLTLHAQIWGGESQSLVPSSVDVEYAWRATSGSDVINVPEQNSSSVDVTANKEGQAEVECKATFTLPNGAKASATVGTATISVTEALSSVEIEGKNRVSIGKSVTLTAKPNVEPAGITYKWEIVDGATFAEIDGADNGKTVNIKGLAVGTAKVKVTATSGEDVVESTEYSINVQEAVLVEDIKITGASTVVYVKDTLELVATVTPADADDPTVTWSSDGEGIATVDQNGVVTGVSEGTTTIKATANDDSGAEGIFMVTVMKKSTPSMPFFPGSGDTQGTTGNQAGMVTGNGMWTGMWGGTGGTTAQSGAQTVGGFSDVPKGSYFADAVVWAVNNNITNGTSATTFSPNASCTRAQQVTFLWRQAGCPEPSTSNNPFTDVKADQYYYKAVLWAVGKGITNGTSATTFSPDATVTRAQCVTFLWRSAGKPNAGTGRTFTDVPASGPYTEAINWAAARGVTQGTSATTFSPSNPCTRAQIVTFMYRAVN